MNEPAPAAPAGEPQGNPAGRADEGRGTTTEPTNENQAWYEGFDLSDEDVGFIQNRSFDNLGSVLNNVRDFEKMKGVPADQLLKLPKDMGEEGAMDDVYKTLGRPDEPTGYKEFTPPEELKDLKIDEGRMEWANKMAHSLGLNQAQRDKMVEATLEYEGEIVSAAHKAVEEQQQADYAALQKEWGNSSKEREELGRRAAKAFLPKDQADALMDAMEASLGTANMLKLFANIGEKMGEDKINDLNGGTDRPFGKTPEQIKADIEELKTEIQGDQERLKNYNMNKGPDVERMKKLNQMLHGKNG